MQLDPTRPLFGLQPHTHAARACNYCSLSRLLTTYPYRLRVTGSLELHVSCNLDSYALQIPLSGPLRPGIPLSLINHGRSHNQPASA